MKPTTLAEAIIELKVKLGSDGVTDLLNTNRDGLIAYHNSLGRWIRNTWGLWTDSDLMKHMVVLGFSHPDDISFSIIKECWLQLRGLPSELLSDIIEYKQYWDNVDKDSK